MSLYNYNRLFQSPAGKELIRKAFTTGSTSGGPLIREYLDIEITNEIVRLVPELALPETKYGAQKTHEFNRITALPDAGSAMGENSTTPTRQSSMERATVDLKIMKRKGSVTGFLQAAAADDYDAQEVELENHLQAFGNDMATYMLYGNAGADAYTFSGLDRFIASKRSNETWGGTVPTDMSDLDSMIDYSNRKKGIKHRRCFIMSPEMLTKLSSLWTTVRDTRPAQRAGTDGLMVDGAYRLQTYRNIPILESSQTRPQGQMGAVVYSEVGGGALTDDERFFQVAPVTWDGEQIASDEVSDTSSSATSITLTWTAYTGALYYKIYAADTSGQEKLVKIISAFTYDANGTISAAVTSTTWTTEPLTADTTTVPTAMQDDRPLDYNSSVPMETIFLWDLHPHQGLGKLAYTNNDGNRINGLATIIPLAKTEDRDDFLIKSYVALIDSFEATSGMHRGLRVA